MIKNVVLDIGNVLVDWDWEGYFEYLGYAEEDVFDALAGYTVLSHRWNDLDRGVKGDENVINEMIDIAPMWESDILHVMEHIGEAVIQFKYAKRWIREIKEAGKKVYLLSNYSEYLFNQTEEDELDFIELTDGVVFSFREHYIKPEKEIYEILLDRYNLKAEECVFIDDKEENIEGAKALGFETILFDDFENVHEKLNGMIL
ncbi:MAG: HAD family phosphatase [Eubacterium sp.]|nr:HAD family phosphatase [Eubacterium sp.]